jgi:hypothetical protein
MPRKRRRAPIISIGGDLRRLDTALADLVSEIARGNLRGIVINLLPKGRRRPLDSMVYGKVRVADLALVGAVLSSRAVALEAERAQQHGASRSDE